MVLLRGCCCCVVRAPFTPVPPCRTTWTGSGAEDKSSDSNRRENSLVHSSQLRIRIYLRDDKRCLEELTKEENGGVSFRAAIVSFDRTNF